MTMWVFWLILSIVLLILEIFTISFFVFFPAIAAFITAILALFNVGIELQITVFLVLAIVMLVFMKPIMKRYMKVKDTPTNTNRLIGKKAKVIVEINNLENVGQVKLGGEFWSACNEVDEILKEGEIVTVVAIDGVKLKVSQK